MQVFVDTCPVLTESAVALGNFDGVHVGHTKLVDKLLSFGLPSAVYTFEEHPVNVIKGEGTVLSINTNYEKSSIFDSLGVDILIFDDFSDIRDMTPEVFVKTVLIDKLHAKEVVCGFNYRFGKNGEGNPQRLGQLLEKYGSRLTVINEVKLDAVSVSSTRVRNALENGDVELANRLLGRRFFIDSTVVHGCALGRQMGFPTVNVSFERGRLVLPYGVYLVKCIVDNNESHVAVVNVGVRPTVNTTDLIPTVEAHLIDYSGDLYGHRVRIEFYKKLRGEVKFESLEKLKEQIAKDIQSCREYFEVER